MPYGRGAARVPKRLYAILRYFSCTDPNRYLSSFDMVPLQTGISQMCVPYNNLSHTPLGEGVLAAVNNKFSLHSDKLSLGWFPAPWSWERMPAGVCLCVLPYRGVPPWPLSVFFFEWMGGSEGTGLRSLALTNQPHPHLVYTHSLSTATRHPSPWCFLSLPYTNTHPLLLSHLFEHKLIMQPWYPFYNL